MPEWLSTLLVSAVSGLVVAIPVSLLSVRLSLRRYYTERWWERKAEMYVELVGALHQLEALYLRRSEIEGPPFEGAEFMGLGGAGLDAEDQAALDAAEAVVDRARAIGVLVLSVPANAILHDLQRKRMEAEARLAFDPQPEGWLSGEWAKAALWARLRLRSEGMRDLGIKLDPEQMVQGTAQVRQISSDRRGTSRPDPPS